MSSNTDIDLDQLIKKFDPVLKHINLHRFLWLFTVVCAFIAWNRGLMLLYVLVAFLLAVLLVSYIYRFINLSNIHISRQLPRVVNANSAFAISYTVQTSGHKYLLSLDDVFSSDATEEQATVNHQLFITHVYKTADIKTYTHVASRGVFTSACVTLSCAYPLGILHASKKQPLPPQTLYVLPEVFAIDGIDVPLGNNSQNGELSSSQKGQFDEFTNLRQYRRGDPFKLIHWRASAKQMGQNQSFLSKDFDSTDTPALLLVINQFQCRDASFETMLKIVSSIVHFAYKLQRRCIVAGVDNNDGQLWHIDLATNTPHLDENLLPLATTHWIDSRRANTINTNGISNYEQLLSQCIVQFYHTQKTNTLITFGLFEHSLPTSTPINHQAFVIKKNASSVFSSPVCYINPDANSEELEALFSSSSSS